MTNLTIHNFGSCATLTIVVLAATARCNKRVRHGRLVCEAIHPALQINPNLMISMTLNMAQFFQGLIDLIAKPVVKDDGRNPIPDSRGSPWCVVRNGGQFMLNLGQASYLISGSAHKSLGKLTAYIDGRGGVCYLSTTGREVVVK